MKDLIEDDKVSKNIPQKNQTTRKPPLDEVISSAKQRVPNDPQPNTKITDDFHEIILEH